MYSLDVNVIKRPKTEETPNLEVGRFSGHGSAPPPLSLSKFRGDTAG